MIFNKISVLGAGSMGAQIAAEIANAGISCVLFDLKTNLVIKSLDKLKKAQPPIFADNNIINLIQPANLIKDLALLESSDLIIEAVSEDIKIKSALYIKISKFINNKAILVSNSSGLSINKLSSYLPKNLKSRFLGMHFFNPPRYLQLVELIKNDYTNKKYINICEEFLVQNLGKLVVHAKDSPNFMANRLGIGLWCLAVDLADKYNIDFAIVDKLTGKLLGRPKSAIFRTADLVGLDILNQVIINSRKIGKEKEPLYNILQAKPWMKYLIKKNYLGAKTNKGIYHKTDKGLYVFNKNKIKYDLIDKNKLDIDQKVVAALKNKNWKSRIKSLRKLDFKEHPQAGFVSDLLDKTFIYAAEIAKDISDNIFDLDAVIKWGFGWKLGIFEIWQEAGLDIINKSNNCEINWIKKLIKNKNKFYTKSGGLDLKAKSLNKYINKYNNNIYENFFASSNLVPFNLLSKDIKIIKEDDFCMLWQWGNKNKYNNSYIISFKTKMAVLNASVLQFLDKAIDICVAEKKCLIIYQKDISHFSAGADLLSLAELFLSEGEGALDDILNKFQQLFLKIRYANIPVIAAVQGYAFGGGCELLLHCDKVIAAQNSFIGLVETSIGLIPAAGGCTFIARKLSKELSSKSNSASSHDLLIKYYENIAKAIFSKSAKDARNIGYLDKCDIDIMQPGLLLSQALDNMGVLLQNYKSNKKQKIMAMGDDLYALLKLYIINMQQGDFISEHDALVADKLARVICGPKGSNYGDLIDEDIYLKSERDVFMQLAALDKTQQRIEHTLKTGKVLRN